MFDPAWKLFLIGKLTRNRTSKFATSYRSENQLLSLSTRKHRKSNRNRFVFIHDFICVLRGVHLIFVQSPLLLHSFMIIFNWTNYLTKLIDNSMYFDYTSYMLIWNWVYYYYALRLSTSMCGSLRSRFRIFDLSRYYGNTYLISPT